MGRRGEIKNFKFPPLLSNFLPSFIERALEPSGQHGKGESCSQSPHWISPCKYVRLTKPAEVCEIAVLSWLN